MPGALFNSINPLCRLDIERVTPQPVDRICREGNNATVFQYFDGSVNLYHYLTGQIAHFGSTFARSPHQTVLYSFS